MENKINIAELLKDCPKGMELDCVLFDGVVFDEIDDDEEWDCPIHIKTKDGEIWDLTSTGCWADSPSAKCVIFPKGKTTWEGFHKPFKPGDIVITDNNEHAFIYSGENDSFWECYCGVFCGTRDICLNSRVWSGKSHNIRLATEEEKQKLFQVIKDNGYKWNAETKTLEKLVEPQFNVGDKIREKGDEAAAFTISDIDDSCYYCGEYIICNICDQDDYELVPDRFDINTLKPFESRVLVRDTADEPWEPAFFGYYKDAHKYPTFSIVGGSYWKQCIPYEENKHLLGKTNDCIDFYKTWES